MFGGTAGDCVIQFPQVSGAMMLSSAHTFTCFMKCYRVDCGLSYLPRNGAGCGLSDALQPTLAGGWPGLPILPCPFATHGSFLSLMYRSAVRCSVV